MVKELQVTAGIPSVFIKSVHQPPTSTNLTTDLLSARRKLRIHGMESIIAAHLAHLRVASRVDGTTLFW